MTITRFRHLPDTGRAAIVAEALNHVRNTGPLLRVFADSQSERGALCLFCRGQGEGILRLRITEPSAALEVPLQSCTVGGRPAVEAFLESALRHDFVEETPLSASAAHNDQGPISLITHHRSIGLLFTALRILRKLTKPDDPQADDAKMVLQHLMPVIHDLASAHGLVVIEPDKILTRLD